jgi:enamine deaminase RidA (YjgF/YER057c/UK114 family)
MNEAWQAWIGKDVPARACVQAVLGSPKTLVEIMVTAAK